MSLQKEEFIRGIVWVLTTCGVPIVQELYESSFLCGQKYEYRSCFMEYELKRNAEFVNKLGEQEVMGI